MIRFAVLALLLSLLALTANAQTQRPAKSGPRDRVDEAIARGITFLLSNQKTNGSFADSQETAITSLAVLSLAASGHQPTDRTREGDGMRRAIQFLLRLDRQTKEGFFGENDNSRMYGHGITTLTLTELLGMGSDKIQDGLIRDRVRKAIDLILRAQRVRKRDASHNGGWRYMPDSTDSDLSVTVWQLLALRSAKNAGLEVPKDAIESAVKYLKESYKPVVEPKPGVPLLGGFAYQPGQNPTYAMASAGMLALVVSGEYDAPEVEGTANWLRDNPPDPGNYWFYYGTYYYAQAMFQRGGEHAIEGRKLTEQNILNHQQEDGSWQGTQGQELGVGKIYSTSLAILSLAVKFHYLPIYQR